jgi:hypothetical protein
VLLGNSVSASQLSVDCRALPPGCRPRQVRSFTAPLCWSKVNFEENFQQHPVFRAPAQDQELFCFHTLCRCLSICSCASCGLCVFACVCVPVCRWGSFKQLALSANVDAPCPTDSAHLYISVVVPVCAKTTQPSCFMNCRVLKQSKRKYAAYTHTNNDLKHACAKAYREAENVMFTIDHAKAAMQNPTSVQFIVSAVDDATYYHVSS